MNNPLSDHAITIDYRGIQPYHDVWQAMKNQNINPLWPGDRILMAEHHPVYTLGSSGGREHLLRETDIEIVSSDRGGSITYHGPGMLMIYPMINLRTTTIKLSQWIDTLEACFVDFLSRSIKNVHTIKDKRGVYVNHQKIASIGMRIAHGRTYHGICLNMSCDLSPFDNINPCGYPEMRMTQWIEHCDIPADWYSTFEHIFGSYFRYTSINREVKNVRLTEASKITWPGKTSSDPDQSSPLSSASKAILA
jgi:lipoyl(octanoyl) transferase